MLKDAYELASKPERDRILDSSFIGSYGPFPVHNVKFNKLVQYLEKVNDNLQVENPSDYQKALKDTIKMQLNLARLKILNDYALKEKKEGGAGSSVLTALSFRNWCGAGTPIYDNIKNNLDDPNKMFKIDRICRDHDLRYTQAKSRIEQKEADNIMIEEIYNEYVVNFNRNFITGNYQSDFTTWTSSFSTVFNYLMTGLETAYAASVVKGIGVKAYQIGKFGYDIYRTYNPIQDYPEGYFDDIPQMLAAAREGDIEGAGNPYIESAVEQLQNLYERIPRAQMPYRARGLYNRLKNNLSGIALTFVASTIIKDRIFALGSLAAIGLKRAIETVTNYRFVDLTKHDVSDEDLENMIKAFETLQNQYLEQSGFNPIKIGDEWTKEKIEVPSIQKIKEDVDIIIETNKTYNELNQTMVDAIVSEPHGGSELSDKPQSLVEPEPEPEPDLDTVPSPEQVSEDKLKRLDEYKDLYSYIKKRFSETNLVEEERPYQDLPSIEPISGIKERPEVPDIEKDIKDAKTSSILDIPKEEDETIQQNKDLGQNSKPDEIKNKMEL
jgi:hypothetical protein